MRVSTESLSETIDAIGERFSRMFPGNVFRYEFVDEAFNRQYQNEQQKWLEGFAYHVEIGIGLFIILGVVSISIALATVAFQALRAATADPTRSLRVAWAGDTFGRIHKNDTTMKAPICVLIALTCLLSLESSAQFKVVGYYPLRSALTADVDAVPFDRLTHINLAFLNPDSLGNFTQDLSTLAPFVKAAHDHGVKVLFSIAGGGRHAQYHSLLKDENRARLIEDLVELTLEHNVDGIDVDLEGRDIDEHYEPFVVELASALRQHDKLITSAIAVYYKDQLSDRALAAYDFVNIMVYDRTGPWRPEDIGPHSTYEDAVEDLEYFSGERALPKEKMTLGVPFYGYWFDEAFQYSVVSRTYGGVVGSFPGAEMVDEWMMPDGNVLYYNGLPTIRRKTELAMKEAGGIMIWQVLGDAPGPKSLLRAINDVAGR